MNMITFELKMIFRIFILLVLINILSVKFALAQEKIIHLSEIEKKNIIKINLLSPFLGTLSLQLERIINNESSVQIGFYYFSGTIINNSFPVGAICFTPEYRLYLDDEAPRGFYLQPYMRLGRFWDDQNIKVKSTFTAAAVGLLFGKQWLFYDKFTLDIYAGPLYTKPFLDNSSYNIKDLPQLVNGYWLRAGFTAGYYF
jgi:hypothetical protein